MALNSIVLAGSLLSAVEVANSGDTKIAKATLSFIVPTSGGNYDDAQIKIVAFGNRADALATYEQGASVIITGSLNVNKIDTPESKRNVYELIISTIAAGSDGLMLNCVNLVGRLGNDPDVKRFESGSVKAGFSLAANRTKQVTDWFDAQVWGKTADVVATYCRKGSQVGITGVLHAEFWADKNTGDPRMKLLIKGDRIELLGKSENTNGNTAQPVAAGIDDDF